MKATENTIKIYDIRIISGQATYKFKMFATKEQEYLNNDNNGKYPWEFVQPHTKVVPVGTEIEVRVSQTWSGIYYEARVYEKRDENEELRPVIFSISHLKEYSMEQLKDLFDRQEKANKVLEVRPTIQQVLKEANEKCESAKRNAGGDWVLTQDEGYGEAMLESVANKYGYTIDDVWDYMREQDDQIPL